MGLVFLEYSILFPPLKSISCFADWRVANVGGDNMKVVLSSAQSFESFGLVDVFLS